MRGPRKFGIVAGQGALPRLLAERITARGHLVCAVQLSRACELPAHIARRPMPLGRVAAMARYFENEGARQVFLAGAVSAPPWRELRPDLGATAPLLAAFTGQGDAILRATALAFRSRGVAVEDPRPWLEDLLMRSGPNAGPAIEPLLRDTIDAAVRGAALAGQRRIGQGALGYRGQLAGLETSAGTNALIARAPGPGAVLAKVAAYGQDLRFDLPAIGPTTVRLAAAVGLRAIVLESGVGLILEPSVVLSLCEAHGISLIGIPQGSAVGCACQPRSTHLHSRP